MRIDEARPVLKYLMSLGMVPMLVGEAGIGKTEIIKRIGEETKRKVIILMLSQMEPGDLLGLPTRDEKEQMTVYYKPDWWPKDGNCIIFLDEINRAHVTVRHAVMQLLIDRRIHNNILPDGCWLVAAMNPETEDYEVEEIIDRAFIDRFVWIKLTNNLEDWKRFMSQAKRASFRFLKALDNVAKFSMEHFQFGKFDLPELKPTPRSLERLSKILDNCPENLQQYMEEIAIGVCGKAGAKIATEYMKLSRSGFSYEDLLAGDVEAVKNASPAERAQALENVMVYLLSKFDDKTGKLDIEPEVIDNLCKALEAYKREELGPLYRYAKDEYRKLIVALKKFDSFATFFAKILAGMSLNEAIEKLR